MFYSLQLEKNKYMYVFACKTQNYLLIPLFQPQRGTNTVVGASGVRAHKFVLSA